MSEKPNVPMIPKHQAEAQMMHLTWIVKWLVICIIIGFICNVCSVYIFVNGYNSRTKDWLNTYAGLQRQYTITGVANEKEETGVVQQLPVP